jgi:flagellar basal-body rod modification protein FlgD
MTTSAGATQGSTIVSGTTPLPAGSTSSGSSAAASSALASQQIAGNFQSFLTLLTTQLQNQNPLDPLDTNQFTQQLVEFAGVQQQLNTNDSLATLVSLQQATQSTEALSYVGKTATVSGSTAVMTNSEAVWGVSIPTASTMDVSIASSTGQTVFTGTYNVSAGNNQPFEWNGMGSDGTQYPDGNYTMTATAKDSSGNTVAVATSVGGEVTSVDLTKTPPLLTIGGQTYTMSQIQSIIASSSSTSN